MSNSNTKSIQTEDIEILCSQAEDIYKLSKLINQYCEQHQLCEELNDISPITKLLYNLSDNLLCNLQNTVNGNPDI